MTKITLDEVKKLARLARITITDQEAEKFQTEIGAVLQLVEQLEDVDTKGVKPTSQVTGLVNVTREDVVVDYGTDQQSLLKNTPSTQDGYVKVRKVL